MSLLPIIEQALLAGFGEEKILQFIGTRIPQLAKGINKAKENGIDPAKILRFLSYSNPKKASKEQIEKQKTTNDQYLSKVGIQTKQERNDKRNRSLALTLGIGAGLLGTLSEEQPEEQSAALPISNKGKPKPLAKSHIQSLQAQSSNQNLPSPMDLFSSQAQQPPINPNNIPQQQVNPQQNKSILSRENLESQAKQLNINPERSVEILNNLDQGERIKKLAEAGNNPKNIANILRSALTPDQRNTLGTMINSGEAKSLESMVEDYLSTSQNQAENTPINAIEEKKSPEKPKVGEIVATSSGFGNLKSIRENDALIEENGKLKKVPVDEIVTSPLPEKDLADLFDDLILGIEKETGQDVSRNVNWAGYNADTNTLLYLPHGGDMYEYKDIPEDEVRNLTNVLHKRKTTGKNWIGPWVEGTNSPIGAAISNLINRLKKERGIGKEYSRKFDTIYSALEPGSEASKLKKKKKKKKK